MGNYFKDLINHPKRILKLSLVALAVLFVLGLALLLLGSQVMGIVLMSAGVCCVVVALTVFWRCRSRRVPAAERGSGPQGLPILRQGHRLSDGGHTHAEAI